MIRILNGHVLDRLRDLPDDSVHCCITSPPYWKIRSFGLPPQIWGGDSQCSHTFIFRAVPTETYTLAYRPEERVTEMEGTCTKCGAWCGSLGSEPTPELYIKNMQLVFEEVRRVMRPDGILWLDLGDRRAVQDKNTPNLKPKDLIGLPWMTAFALRSDGWYLRSAVILAKTAPIPEANVDRPISSYQFLFMLTKSNRYYYDGYAVGDKEINLNVKDVWSFDHEYSSTGNHFGVFPKSLPERCIKLSTSSKGACARCGAQYVRVKNKMKVQNTNSHKRLPKIKTTITNEWMPSCSCDEGVKPALVLDPFGGTGTTSVVAELLQRDSVSIELSGEYLITMQERISRDSGLFADVIVEKAHD